MNRRNYKKSLATIDMTPLMDLTFMLLIIFVITVPAMYYKSDVQLTPPESNTNDKMKVEENSIFVELDKNGQIWIGDSSNQRSRSIASPYDLTAELKSLHSTKPDLIVFLVGDKERKYEEIIEIANAVQHAGVDTLSLVFNPEKGK